MSTVYELPCQPEADPMRSMLDMLFRQAPGGLVELAWTSPQAPHKPNGAKLYGVDELDELVDHALRLNITPNRNVYVSAGLRREDAPRDRRGRDEDVIGVTAIKADFDALGAFDTALAKVSAKGIPPSFITITGLSPHKRGQLWWVLEELVSDTRETTLIEDCLAHWLGGDPSIKNPSRIMRLAGSVAWPLKAGRTLELTTGESTGRVYMFEAIARVAHEMAPSAPAPSTNILDFNTASRQRPDLDEYLANIARDEQWHDNARGAVASLIARGTPLSVIVDLLAPLVQRAGYTLAETRAELQIMADGAIRRGFAPEFEEPLRDAPQAPKAPSFPILDLDALADVKPPEWMVDQYLVARGVSMLYAPPASFKSFIALDLALSVAHGVSWRGQVVKPASVLYIAAEGKSGIYARVIAWAQHRGATGLAQPFRVCPSAVNFLDAAEVARFATCLQELDQPPTYVVVDTLARCSLGADENSATDAGRIMAAATHIAEAVNGHVMLVHHSGKDAAKGARGSSAFRGAVDTELRLERDDRRVWIRVDKHKDAEEPKPACFDMVAIEGLHPKTGEILSSLVPVADSGHPASPPADKSRYGRNETAILAFLATTNEATFTLIRDHLNIEKGNLGRALRRLEHAGAIVKSDDARPFYRLPEMEGADD